MELWQSLWKEGRKRKVLLYESDDDSGASGMEKLLQDTEDERFRKSVFDVMIDKIVSQLDLWYEEIRNICTIFEVILK